MRSSDWSSDVCSSDLKVEGHVRAGYSHTGGYGGDNYMLQGAVNVPVIADVLALRATGYRFSDSGYYRDNANTDPTLQEAAAFYGAEPYANAYTNIGKIGRASCRERVCTYV